MDTKSENSCDRVVTNEVKLLIHVQVINPQSILQMVPSSYSFSEPEGTIVGVLENFSTN
jgi:hypothetical protein